jgi:hypothetical protein
MQRVKRDPRYWQQQYRQSPERLPEAQIDDALAPELRYGSRFGISGDRHRTRGNSGIDKDWSLDLGSTATVGAINYPAKISFRGTNATCAGGAGQPDIVVYPTGLLGSGSQASIVAFDNLYSGCVADGTVPTIYWAYDTGGTITTSPVFSADGTQVAFMQTDGVGNGSLVLLKWAASGGTVGGPITVPQKRNSDYPGCSAPCMTAVLVEDASGTQHPDSNSSVFYYYSGDTAYVGDDAGWLHEINPVFNGVPAEVGSGGWPVQVNPGAATALTSPVYDQVSGFAFVTDVGGFLYRVGPITAAVSTTSGQLDVSFLEGGAGIVQGPIVDSAAEVVYVFASSDGSGSCVGGADCTAVYQLAADFAGGDLGSEAVVGNSTVEPAAPSPMYIGAFDSTYENSANATGNLYVCGNTGGDPTLYQVPIAAGAFGTVNTGPALSTGTTPCSPVTDLLNPNASGGSTERIFVSAETSGVSSGCSAGGCIFNFKDTPWLPKTSYTVGQEVLDSHFQIQVVSVAGTSGAAAPGWSTIINHSTTDGTVHWLNQGVESAVTLAAWAPTTAYALHAKILDGNNNIEFVTTAGTSGAAVTFNPAAGGTTTDGTVTWTNLGALGTAAMAAAGGTSGIIVDNTVGSGTLAGASQVYFSTLKGQVCGTSGTGGCAVQASQPALQ